MSDISTIPTGELVESLADVSAIHKSAEKELNRSFDGFLSILAPNASKVIEPNAYNYDFDYDEYYDAHMHVYHLHIEDIAIDGTDNTFVATTRVEFSDADSEKEPRLFGEEDSDEETRFEMSLPIFQDAVTKSREVSLVVNIDEEASDQATLVVRRDIKKSKYKAYRTKVHYENGTEASDEHVELAIRLLDLGAAHIAVVSASKSE